MKKQPKKKKNMSDTIDPFEEEGNDNPELGTLAEQAAVAEEWDKMVAAASNVEPLLGADPTPVMIVEEEEPNS